MSRKPHQGESPERSFHTSFRPSRNCITKAHQPAAAQCLLAPRRGAESRPPASQLARRDASTPRYAAAPPEHCQVPENRASGSQIAAGAKLVEAVVGQPPRLEPDAQLVIAPVALLGMITSHTCPRFRRVGNTDNRPFVAGSTPLSPLRSCARRAVTRVRCPWCLPACMPQAPPAPGRRGARAHSQAQTRQWLGARDCAPRPTQGG